MSASATAVSAQPPTFPCAAVPFVTVHARTSFGEVEIWPNTDAMWVAVTGTNHAPAMEVYRDLRGTPRGSRASVITGRNLTAISTARIEDHVVALSTLQWLTGGETSSDPWIVDHWALPVSGAASGLYVRGHKFTRVYTRTAHDRVYPSPFATERHLNLAAMPELVSRLEEELRSPNREASLLPALAHLHRARFQIPFYTTPDEEIVVLWAGFEALMKLPRRLEPRDVSPAWATCIPSARLRGVLRRAFMWEERLGRDTEIQRRVIAELRGIAGALRPTTEAGVKEWAERAYEVRNRRAHGALLDAPRLYLEQYRTDIFSCGMLIARTLLAERLLPSPTSALAHRRVARCEAVFAFASVLDQFADELKGRKRTDLYPTPVLSHAELERLREAANDLAVVTGHLVDARSARADLRSIRQTMALVLSEWAKTLDQLSIVTPVAGLHGEISSLIKSGVTGDALEARIAEALRHRDSADPHAYGGSGTASPALLMGGVLPIWEWANAYIGLAELTE